MNLPTPIAVTKLADQINAQIIGDKHLVATGINEIHHVRPGDITFVDVKKYFDKALNSKATVILLNEKTDCPEGKVLLLCDDPFTAYNDIVKSYRPFRPLTVNISPEAKIAASTIIEPNVVIGPNVTIGENCYIQANSVITGHVIIGNNVMIESGVVIGTDAFYYKRTETGHIKWRAAGRVIIEDNVDIGSTSTINIGVSSDTIIGEGSKLDSQIQVGHDTVIGKRCIVAAQSAIAGNTIIEDDVVLYGQVGVVQNITIGAKATVLAKALVTKSIEGGKTYFGAPANEYREIYKELAALRKLPALLKKLRSSK